MQKQENSSVLIFLTLCFVVLTCVLVTSFPEQINRLVIVITLFPCLPEGTPSTQALSHEVSTFRATSWIANYSSLCQDIQYFTLSPSKCCAVHYCVLRSKIQFLIIQAFKSKLEVIFSTTFKAVCLRIGRWDTIEPWHFQPLQIFKPNASPFWMLSF